LRVLTVARWYPSHDSPGRGSFVADLVRATLAAGVDARVVSFDRVLVRGRQEQRDAVRVAARTAYDRVVTPAALFVTHASPEGTARVPVARVPVVRRPGTGDPAALIEDHLAALRPFVAQLVGAWRPDVIHAHTGLPDGIVATAVGRDLRIPVVVSEHMSTIESELADPVSLERYRELLGEGVRLVGVSPSVASRVATLLGVPADTLGVLPNPVEDAAFPLAEPTGRDPNELLWVGSIGEHKGIDVLLRAFAALRDRRPHLHLRLVGGERVSGDRARLVGLAARLGVGASVAFEGWLARDQVAAAMVRAGVFVHPSPSETFGVAAAEAILTGLPVAARQSGGVPWIIELSGGFGRVAADDGPEGFADAIERTLDGSFGVAPEAARLRLLQAVGAPAVARQAIELYEAGVASVRPAGVAAAGAGAQPTEAAAARRATGTTTASRTQGSDRLPEVLVATGREQAFALVAALPTALQRRLTLVVPPPTSDAAETLPTDMSAVIRVVEADAVRPGTPRPRGRSPLARVRRALWRPAPTADELLVRAALTAARQARSGRGPVDLVAIDAPAAGLIGGLEPGRARLAPGSLRWLADRWTAEHDRVPP
jgi:D-inositol-3-phosphate glycosyltransferase